MKNKKSMEVSPMSILIATAILGLVLVVTIYGIIPILTGEQLPFLRGQTEQVTQDCDLDDYIGISDKCPCDPETHGKEDKCGQVSAIAAKNCPSLCKNEKSNNA